MPWVSKEAVVRGGTGIPCTGPAEPGESSPSGGVESDSGTRIVGVRAGRE